MLRTDRNADQAHGAPEAGNTTGHLCPCYNGSDLPKPHSWAGPGRVAPAATHFSDMGGGGGGEGFRGGAVGAGEDIFPDDLRNTTTPRPGSGEDAGRGGVEAGGCTPRDKLGRGPMKVGWEAKVLRATGSKNSAILDSSECQTHKVLRAWNLRFLEPEIPKAQNSHKPLEFKNPGILEE